MPGLGPLRVYMLVKDKADIGKVREAVADNVRRFNQSLNVDGKREFSLLGQPDRHWESIFRYWSNVEPDIVGDLSRYGIPVWSGVWASWACGVLSGLPRGR